jgi:ABC-type antimicrobial peptide transport system permease subunit
VRVVTQDLGAFDAFRAAFIAPNVLVLVIGLVNLAAGAVLGIRERFLDRAVRKTIGFTPQQVAASVVTTTGTLGFLAVMLGILVGFVLTWVLMQSVGTDTGVGPGIGQPAGAEVVAVVPAAVVFTAAVGLIASRRAAQAPVAEVLRAD